MPVLCSRVPFFTQWCHNRLEVDSPCQISQFCLWQLSDSNSCHKVALKTKYSHLSNQQMCLGQEKSFHFFDFCGLAFARHSATIHGLCLWHLGSLLAKNCIQNCLVFKIRWILFGVKWTFGQFSYCYKWRRIFLTPVKMCQCTKSVVLFQWVLMGFVGNMTYIHVHEVAFFPYYDSGGPFFSVTIPPWIK